jgi:hypothetical protein
VARSRTTFSKGNAGLHAFSPGRSGNPQGRKPLIDDIHALARQHAPEAIAGLVEFMRQREDPHLAMSAMTALLDRAYGRPPQAILAGGTGEPVKIEYEFVWGTTKTPEGASPVIDTEAEDTKGDTPALVWADGKPMNSG